MSEYLEDILLLNHKIELGCGRVCKMFTVIAKEDKIMTDTQVRYATNVENIRHNKAVEEENIRHNAQTEAQAAMDLAEKARANRAAEANARYAADQSYAGNAAKAAATEYSARANERTARMKVTADAAQKEADRQLTSTQKQLDRDQQAAIADAQNAINADRNSIEKFKADLTSVKNDRDYEIALGTLEDKVNQTKIKLDELNLKVKEYKHRVASDWFNNVNNAVNGAVKSADIILGRIDTMAKGGQDTAGNAINDLQRFVQTLDTLDRMMRRQSQDNRRRNH